VTAVQPGLAGHVELHWHRGPLASFDTETSGISVDTDRIVTAALIRPNRQTLRWMTDADGFDIPDAAARIHGITTQDARTHGRPAKAVVEEIAAALAGELSAGAALVVMNAPFDLTLLNRECARHGAPTVAERIGRPVGPVIDPLVLDRAADKYRKGKRTLEALAKEYGVALTDAHSADADAQATLGVALAIAERHEQLQVPARVVHGWQVTMHERWAANYQAFLRKTRPDATVSGAWPLVAAQTGGGA
jgi:DNA polymerase-3 subunit epsilon